MNALLILGNQLFSLDHLPKDITRESIHVFMREDEELCRHYRIHKHKIIFFLSAMRNYADEIVEDVKSLTYQKLNPEEKSKRYEDHLLEFTKKNKIKKLYFYEIEDKFFEKRILECLKKNNIEFECLQSPMFLCSRQEFEDFSSKNKSLLMANFYKQQRKNLNLLIDEDGNPEGGKWSFDEENRKKLPKSNQPPEIKKAIQNKNTQAVINLVDKVFSDHPGESSDFWLPTDRKSAQKHFSLFLKERFADFGTYEDAIAPHSDFVYHSVLTPFLNIGLLTPKEIVDKSIKYARKNSTPLNSLEGFVRQIIGWREFIRGVYQIHSEKQSNTNFWKHKRKLSRHWYEGNTGVTPLDDSLKKLLKTSYNHHIERLMIIGNMMLLLEVDPREAHDWFMEMYVDSSDWVMGPNVYGMALFSDGGLFATKPYICGSNYWKKMGANMNGDWQDGVDGLYWSFIDRNREFFAKNHRLNMMLRMLDKMDVEKKERIFKAAKALRNKLTKK